MRKLYNFLKVSVLIFYMIVLYNNINISILNIVICILALLFSDVIQSIFHELGHLIGGITSGYKLLQLRLNPIIISKTEQGKYRLEFGFSKFNQCIMVPHKSENYFFYNAFGIILNILITITLVVIYLISYKAFFDIQIILYLSMIVVGINKTISNALPAVRHGYPNDMKILMIISKSQLAKKHYFIYLSTYEKSFFNLPLDPNIIEEIKQEIDGDIDSFFAKQIIKLYNN